jgi:hypothetical protein
MSGSRLILGTSAVETPGRLTLNGVIEGDADAGSVVGGGDVSGDIDTTPRVVELPDAGLPAMYAALGTTITPGDTLRDVALTPSFNPYGAANADGVYVWRPAGHATLRGVRISGTLVVYMQSGYELRVEDAVNLSPARSDYPALIVVGDCDLKYNSDGVTLSESARGINFNPGDASTGMNDNDKADTYPSEIVGLVHVTGSLQTQGTGTIRGGVISENRTDGSGVKVMATTTIVHDDLLTINPPQGYAKSVPMAMLPGSVRQVAESSGGATRGGSIRTVGGEDDVIVGEVGDGELLGK